MQVQTLILCYAQPLLSTSANKQWRRLLPRMRPWDSLRTRNEAIPQQEARAYPFLSIEKYQLHFTTECSVASHNLANRPLFFAEVERITNDLKG